MHYADNSLSIGHTPLVRLNRVPGKTSATILAKIEGRNPAYSVKCRIGAAMIWDAEEKGLIKAGHRDRGAHQRQYRHRSGLRVRGPRLQADPHHARDHEHGAAQGAAVLWGQPDPHPGGRGHEGGHSRGRRDGGRRPREVLPAPAVQEPGEPADPREDHRAGDLGRHRRRRPTSWWPGVGTGGTITGVSRYFEKVQGKALYSVAVEPAGSPVITQTLAGQPLKPGPHKIQGIGAGFIPDNLDLSLVDRVETADERRGHRDGAPSGPGGRHPVRHLLRGRGGRRRAAGAATRVRRQDHRGHPARRGGAISVD